jgi:hypothetical protein
MCPVCSEVDENNKQKLVDLIKSEESRYENIVAGQPDVVSFGGGRRPQQEVFAALTEGGLVLTKDGREVHLRIFRNTVLGQGNRDQSIWKQVRFLSRTGRFKGFRSL